MVRFTPTGNVALLRQRLASARAALVDSMPRLLSELGSELAGDLSIAAPRGKGDGAPVGGDAPGPLSGSFSFLVEETGEASGALEVFTTQPNKLQFVTQGTGVYGPNGQRIYPRTAKALYWEGAPHPMSSVAGQKPNDFVTPLLDEADAIAQERVDILVESVLSGIGGG